MRSINNKVFSAAVIKRWASKPRKERSCVAVRAHARVSMPEQNRCGMVSRDNCMCDHGIIARGCSSKEQLTTAVYFFHRNTLASVFMFSLPLGAIVFSGGWSWWLYSSTLWCSSHCHPVVCFWKVPAILTKTWVQLELFVNDERVYSECSSAGWLTVFFFVFTFLFSPVFPLLLQSGSHPFSLIVQFIHGFCSVAVQ